MEGENVVRTLPHAKLAEDLYRSLKGAGNCSGAEDDENIEKIRSTIARVGFGALREANVRRCGEVFHPLESWSLTDWACAAAGEMGEACNVVKKIRRLHSQRAQETKPSQKTLGELEAALAEELADVVIYVDLLAARADINLVEAVRAKFNKVSIERGSKERL